MKLMNNKILLHMIKDILCCILALLICIGVFALFVLCIMFYTSLPYETTHSTFAMIIKYFLVGVPVITTFTMGLVVWYDDVKHRIRSNTYEN